jgi:hypothetical protein
VLRVDVEVCVEPHDLNLSPRPVMSGCRQSPDVGADDSGRCPLRAIFWICGDRYIIPSGTGTFVGSPSGTPSREERGIMTEPPGDADQAMTTTRISPAVVPTIVVAAVHRSRSVIRSSESRSTAGGGTSSVSPVAISQAMTERRQEVPLGGYANPRAIRNMSSLRRRMASGCPAVAGRCCSGPPWSATCCPASSGSH